HKSTDSGSTFVNVATAFSARSLAVDSTGAVYVGGLAPEVDASTDGGKTFKAVSTSSFTPTLSTAGNKVYVGGFSPSTSFVTKLDPSGQNILYSTFFGGSMGDFVSGMAVDSEGRAVLVGTMLSPDFPLTAPAASLPVPGRSDGFIAI